MERNLLLFLFLRRGATYKFVINNLRSSGKSQALSRALFTQLESSGRAAVDGESLRTGSVGARAGAGQFRIERVSGVYVFPTLLHPNCTLGFPRLPKLVLLAQSIFPSTHNHYAPRNWFQRNSKISHMQRQNQPFHANS